jgi:hypothetical protein
MNTLATTTARGTSARAPQALLTGTVKNVTSRKLKGPASPQALEFVVAGGCNRTRLQVDTNARRRPTKGSERTTERPPPGRLA